MGQACGGGGGGGGDPPAAVVLPPNRPKRLSPPIIVVVVTPSSPKTPAPQPKPQPPPPGAPTPQPKPLPAPTPAPAPAPAHAASPTRAPAAPTQPKPPPAPTPTPAPAPALAASPSTRAPAAPAQPKPQPPPPAAPTPQPKPRPAPAPAPALATSPSTRAPAADDAHPAALAALVRKARSQLGMDVVAHYNFAFVGCSGSGKSTFVNALRSLADSAPGAAPVGETETTLEIKRYMHPTYSHIALWDIPGAGTLNQPADVYFERQMLYAFDTILILSSSRFFDVDFQVAKKAMEFNTPCAFLRTKADADVKAIARRTKKNMKEASNILREEVTAYFNEQAQGYGIACKIFIVSAWAIQNKRAYHNRLDKSLDEMDEKACIDFVSNAVHPRTL